MNQFRRYSLLLLLAAMSVALAGCGREEAKRGARNSTGKDAPSFKEGKGLFLPETTRRSIGLELAEVAERPLNRRLTAEVQVYDARTGAVSLASGLVNRERARWLHPGQPVSLSDKEGKTAHGRLASVDEQAQPVPGQNEIIIEIPAGGPERSLGMFFTATLTATNEEAAAVIPATALLRAAQGDFVYVVNGERLLRTAVTVGDEADGFVQIKDGLYTGDKVATKPVQILWLTELRLARAGGDSD